MGELGSPRRQPVEKGAISQNPGVWALKKGKLD